MTSIDDDLRARQRYLVNRLRETFGLIGVPIRLSMRSGGENPYGPTSSDARNERRASHPFPLSPPLQTSQRGVAYIAKIGPNLPEAALIPKYALHLLVCDERKDDCVIAGLPIDRGGNSIFCR